MGLVCGGGRLDGGVNSERSEGIERSEGVKKWALGGFVTGRCGRPWLVAARAFFVTNVWNFTSI
jgi:hypothetical protein